MTAQPELQALYAKVPHDLYRRLRRYAFDNDLTHQQVVTDAVQAYLDQRDVPRPVEASA